MATPAEEIIWDDIDGVIDYRWCVLHEGYVPAALIRLPLDAQLVQHADGDGDPVWRERWSKGVCEPCWQLRVECGVPIDERDLARALAMVGEG